MVYILVENFGKQLKQMRLHEGWTQQELSDKSLVSIITIAKIEKEQIKPTPETIEKVTLPFGKKYRVIYAIEDLEGNLTTNIPKRKKRF